MRLHTIGVAGALVALLLAPLPADAQTVRVKVVTSCGAENWPTNLPNVIEMDVTGKLCVTGLVTATNQTSTTGGAASFKLIAANTNNSTLLGAAGPHNIYGGQLSGLGAAPAYLKFYDKATAPTCGTDVPIKVLMIPAAPTAANGAGSNVPIPYGVSVTLGLGICVVTGIADNDNTSVAAATFVINIDYK